MSPIWEALRYTELNPVRARLAARAEDWPWSSAPYHCGLGTANARLATDRWRSRWSEEEWHAYLEAPLDESSMNAIRDSTFGGRPLGSPKFTRALEKAVHRPLTMQRRGPKKHAESVGEQLHLLPERF